MKKTVFIKNAAVLTVTSILMRLIGIFFKIWLGRAVGAEGIGLYQLIFSVYMLASTFASAGIITAVTRLVADELALGCRAGIVKILRRCLELTLLIALLSTAVLFFGADFIAGVLLSDGRAAPAIRVLSLVLPFMGTASVLRGYFIARRKAAPSALSQLLEQTVRIALVVVLLKKYLPFGLSKACAAVLFADIAAHAAAVAYLWLRYTCDKARLPESSGRKSPPFGVVRAILHISAPITAGRYLNTALRTAENLLVPRGLEQNGAGENALAQFGMIKGMALPVLFFPSSLLGAISTMLIPEISEAAARGRRGLVRGAAERIIQLTSLVSFIFAAIFLTAGRQIGGLLFESESVGRLLCALSPIVPLMYLDSVCDGILKGLDQQSFCFKTGLADSGLRILLVLAVLPRFGMTGFLGIMYFSNILTCFLNVGRLLKVSGAKIKAVSWIFLPLAGALCITLTVSRVLLLLGLSPLLYTLLLCLISCPLYAAVLFLTGCVCRDDIADITGSKSKGKKRGAGRAGRTV